MAQQHHDRPASDHEIVVQREFDAPRSLVWAAWTQPEHVARWWGPEGMSARVDELDLRVGGRWRYALIGPNGMEFVMEGVFQEIVEPQLIVTSADLDEGHGAPEPSHVTLTYAFAEIGERTKLTLRISYTTVEDRDAHIAMNVVLGWQSNFNSLEAYLAEMG